MVVDRRFHPRHIIQVPVRLQLPGSDDTYTGNSLNISISGMQLQVPQYVTDAIKRYCSVPQELTLHIETDGQSESLALPARVIVNRRTSSNEYLIGVKFRSMPAATQQTLQNILNRA
ncbi:PilZ domain-containing protein [Thalassotalea mangrovi]|uniref:PilZ domain-containing protein n=1 Tax=Thalassotalea mangrovi TaxID=2572245 RepID=A0A4V5NX04_9GAMM|nr:PilZ domain-containing protein [Thalassotalea mangrovi]TKB43960.1 PilZ domain-containing protein [Thalassotalea mangrovi]